MAGTLILIRHGRTEWNEKGKYQGQSDPPLNEEGRRQIKHLSFELCSLGGDIIYTSPLKRARETASILAEKMSVKVIEDPDLMEMNLGEWEGATRDEILKRYPRLLRLWEENPWEVQIPGGENLSLVAERVYRFLDRVSEKHREGKIIAVTHLIPIFLIRVKLNGIHPSKIWEQSFPNGHMELFPLP